MKRAAMKRRVGKKELLLLGAAAIGLLVVAYVIVSVLVWRDVPAAFASRQKVAKESFLATATGEDAFQRVSAGRHAELVRQTEGLCAVPTAIRWQASVMPSLRRNLDNCKQQQEKYIQALAVHQDTVRFMAAEAHFASSLHDTQSKSLAQPTWAPQAQEQLWRTFAESVRTHDAPEYISRTQQALGDTANEVANAWASVTPGNVTKIAATYNQLAGVQLTLLDEQRAMADQLQERLALLP